MKTIEVLFSEFSNMYGEVYNAMMIEKSTDKVKVIYTKALDEPYFVKHKVDMIYIGNIRESKIYYITEILQKYKDKIKEMIENNTIFLVTGNALEMFGKYIIENNIKHDGLKIFNYYTEKDFKTKYASWVKGTFEDIVIIGHRNQFSKCHGIKDNEKFISVLNGTGSDITSNTEGINYKNFYGTYLLGPFLIMNPLFTKYLFNKLGIKSFKFEKESMDAYNKRMEYFNKEDARYIMTHHG